MCKVRTPQPEALLLLLPLAALGSAPLAVALPTNFILVMADGEWQPSEHAQVLGQAALRALAARADARCLSGSHGLTQACTCMNRHGLGRRVLQ